MTVTTADTVPAKGNFRRNRFLQGLAIGYAFLWLVLAVSPFDRQDWLLENILTFTLAFILLFAHRKFPLSNLSYLLITMFMVLHAIGAHYTYAEVPLGFWLKELLNLGRNHFDRIVHFAFGLLLAYPIREILMRRANLRGAWSYLLTILAVMACSDFFEVLESWVAQIVSPELGTAYLGTQGDVWDAQKDTTAASAGALLSVVLMASLSHITHRRS